MSFPARAETDGEPDGRVLEERLCSLLGALGAQRLGLAIRLPLIGPEHPGRPVNEPAQSPQETQVGAPDPLRPAPPFRVLAVVEGGGRMEADAAALPLAGFYRMLVEARPLDRRPSATGDELERWLHSRGGHRLLGWPYPSDRLPSVYFLALYRESREPGPERLNVAHAGMEALARALAPPPWLPLARGRSPLDSIPKAASPVEDAVPWELLGSSTAVRQLRAELTRMRQSQAPVTLWGELGSGRRRLARWLHGPSLSADRPLVVLLPGSDLIERLGARLSHDHLGAEGAVLLHEVDRLTPAQQARLGGLLRGLAAGAGPRWLCTMRRAPEEAVASGALLAELLPCLAVLQVELPPLRCRADDLPELFLAVLSARRRARCSLDAAARRALAAAPWPGNFPQLEREALRVADLYPRRRRVELAMLSNPLRMPTGEPSLDGLLPLGEAVARVEEIMLRRALRSTEGNKTEAARRLRMSRQGLYNKLRRYGL